MATGLDAAAGILGVVSVAQQLASSIIKVKDFCKDVKNAPEELLDTVASLVHFSKTLTRLGESRNHESNEMRNLKFLSESLRMSKNAADRIAALAMDLQSEMQRNRLRTSTKIVLKQKTINAMMMKLDRCRADLQLAYAIYTDACRRDEYDTIKRYMEEERNERSQLLVSRRTVAVYKEIIEDTGGTEVSNPAKKASPRRNHAVCRDTRTYTARIRFPQWICRYAWDLAFAQAAGQWNFSFKHVNIIGPCHPAADMVLSDDVDGIRNLLQNRRLSIHDEMPWGDSFLCYASSGWGNLKIVRQLLDSGADPMHRYDQILEIWTYWLNSRTARQLSDSETLEHPRKIAQLISERMQDVPPLLDAMAKTPSSWQSEDRLELLECLPPYYEFSTWIFFKVLGQERIESSLDNEEIHNKNILHSLAEHIGIAFVDDSSREQWIDAVHRHAGLQDMIHAKCVYRRAQRTDSFTPFLQVLWETTLNSRWNDEIRQAALPLWINCLRDVGIDLHAYGCREQANLANDNVLLGRFRKFYGMMSFTYGPEAKDWNIWLYHSGDVYAGMFWAFIEDGHQSVPGEWVEVNKVPRYDRWRQGHGPRRMGVKRRTLRRILARARRQELGSEDVERVRRLRECAVTEARSQKTGSSCSDLRTEEMLDLATSLGITTPDLRRRY